MPKKVGGFKLSAGLVGGLLLGAGALYYYFNYMNKPKQVIQPTTNIKQDVQDLSNAGNKLITDLKKEAQNIIQSGTKIAESVNKEGHNIVATVGKTA